MLHERMTTNELFEALQALLDSPQHDLIQELQVHQLELEIQNRELRETQQQLAHSRTRYADLYDFSPVGYASLDQNGVIEEINITGGKLLGDNPHKLIGRSLTEFIVPGEIPYFQSHLRSCSHSRRKRSMELRLITREGEQPVDVQLFTMATQDVDRHTLQFRTAILDVTTRKRAEQALQRSHLELEGRIAERTQELTASHNLVHAVFDSAEEFIYVKDADGRYLMINAAGARFIGKPVERIVGRTDAELLPTEAARQSLEHHRRVIETGARLEFESLIGQRWFQTVAGPYHDHNRKIIGAVGIARDITERRQREGAQAFLNEASAVLSASLDYETTLWSLARAAVPHLADACVVDVVQEDGSIRRLATAGDLGPGGAGTFACEVVIRTGQPEFEESVMCVPLIVRGETMGSIGLMLQRTDRRYNLFDLALAEDLADRAAIAVDNATLFMKEQEANRLKDEFLAIVSHELRTPLMPILGAIYKLRSTRPEDQDLRAALDMIERNAKAQARIVEDLLDISRITTGKLEFNRRPTDLLSIIESAIEVVRPAAEALGIQLNTKLEKPTHRIWCDRDRMQQVIWNLLSNAIKFTPQGGAVEIRLENRNNGARVRISDTGVGINNDFLPHVFERFRQADSFTTRMRGGLGLGLSIVRYIVERHGGSVRAESGGEGKGASFIVDLPYS